MPKKIFWDKRIAERIELQIILRACFVLPFLVISALVLLPLTFDMALSLKFLTVPPIAKHTATVIFVHVNIMSIIYCIERHKRFLFICRVWVTQAMVGSLSRKCSRRILDFNTLNGFCLIRELPLASN